MTGQMAGVSDLAGWAAADLDSDRARKTGADAVAHGYDGFCVLEPHLVLAEQSYGFTGPERFGDAARALKSALDAQGIAYA